MGRSIAVVAAIAAVVVGYVVYFLGVFALLTAAWFAIGVEGAFRPGVWEVTSVWIGCMLAASFGSGLVSGKVAAKIDGSGRGAKVLAGVIACLGLLFELPVLTGSAPVPALPRPDVLPMFDAMGSGQQPVWSMIVYLILGVAGAVIGGSGGSGGSGGREKTA